MGRVIHFEIPSDTPEILVEFYSKVFDWKCQKFGENEYWLADTGADNEPGIHGAITRKDTSHLSVVNTISVKSIEKAISDISTNGGVVLTPVMMIPNIGKVAYFKDPDGNTGGILESV